MPFDYRMTNGQTETCSLTNRFGSEEGIKDFTLNLGLYTRPVVGYLHKHAFPLQPSLDIQAGALHPLHGLGGVGEQVHPDLIELAGIAEHLRQFSKTLLEIDRNLVFTVVLGENLEGRLNTFGYGRLF